jgi:multiple sugar transport system ATP-binding protein
MAELVLQGVSKMFAGSVTAVQDLDLEVRDQELVVLVGPSGCGKTTTLRLIAGLENPDRGMIWIDGRQVNRVAPRDRNIAMVFQHSVLYPHMTVFKNMAVGLTWRCGGDGIRRHWMRWWHPAEARQQAAPRVAIAQQVWDAARILGIEHLLDRWPRQLSGGECQRVALGRAIVRQPAAFLFDEPLSHLDAQLRVEMRREIRRLRERVQGTLVYVTHDQAEALALGDRIVVMHRGRIQQMGPPREVYERPANVFVAGFLGAPGMNLIPGRRHRQGDVVHITGGGLVVSCPAQEWARGRASDEAAVILGIRPEHLWLHGRTNDSAPSTVDRTTQAVGSGRVVMTELCGPSVLAMVALDDRPDQVEARRGRAQDVAQQRAEITVAMPPGETVEVGQEVTVRLVRSRIHLFDAHTGQNLSATCPTDGKPE